MEIIIERYRTLGQASIAAADHIEEIVGTTVSGKGFCTFGLAGGQTPRHTYELLGEPVRTTRTPWPQCHYFWGDERWVPATHPDSNFLMAHNTLLSHLDIPPRNIHRIPTDGRSPETDAASYEKHLRNFFRTLPKSETAGNSPGAAFPIFDLILMGMGSDGHTVSLFPGSDSLTEEIKWVTSVTEGTGTPPVARITLTLPVLNQARNILFLIAGKKKQEIADTFLAEPWPARMKMNYPAACIKPSDRLIWLIASEE